MLHEPSAHSYALLIKRVSGAAVGLILACSLLIFGVRWLGAGLPAADLMALAIIRDPFPPDIIMLDPQRSLTYFAIRDYVGDNHPMLSPDGDRVVFISDRGGGSGLWLLDLTTHQLRMLATGEFYYWLPTWSPDGKQIAYTSATEFVTEIYTLNLEDGIVRQMTDDMGSELYADWSPDGRSIVYVGGDDFDPAGLYVMPVDCPDVEGVCGRVARQLTNQSGFDLSPVWSPDGRQIAFVSDRGGGWDVYVMDSDCVYAPPDAPCYPRIRPMTRERFASQIGSVSWSRDGRQVRFMVGESGSNRVYGLDAGCDQLAESCTLHWLATIHQ